VIGITIDAPPKPAIGQSEIPFPTELKFAPFVFASHFPGESALVSPENASVLSWSHFLRRTGSHFAGKCFSSFVVAFSAANRFPLRRKML